MKNPRAKMPECHRRQTADGAGNSFYRKAILLAVVWGLWSGGRSLPAAQLTWTLTSSVANGTFVYDSFNSAPSQPHPEVLAANIAVSQEIYDPSHQNGFLYQYTWSGGPVALINNSIECFGTHYGDYNSLPDLYVYWNQPLTLAGGTLSVNGTLTESDGYQQTFHFSGTITAPSLVTPPRLLPVGGWSGSTGLSLVFTNVPGVSNALTIWAATNLSLQKTQWANLGHPVESTAGNYLFMDSKATNLPTRFYRVTSP